MIDEKLSPTMQWDFVKRQFFSSCVEKAAENIFFPFCIDFQWEAGTFQGEKKKSKTVDTQNFSHSHHIHKQVLYFAMFTVDPKKQIKAHLLWGYSLMSIKLTVKKEMKNNTA